MKPFPYQLNCVRSAESFGGRTLFSCSMGLGKSAISLWYAERSESFPMIVVCPASVKWQWQAEAEKVLGMRFGVCSGTRSCSLPADRSVIVNYDVLGSWLEELRRLRPRLIVLDECQYIMNPKAKRTRNVMKLCRGVPHVLALSGTPLVNRPIELFPTLNILRPDVFPSRFTFGLKYCAGRRGRWGWEFKGATKTKELHDLLAESCMVRLKKHDVLKDLPEKIRQVVPIDLDDGAAYREAEADFLSWLRRRDPGAAERAERAEAVTRAGYLLRLAARCKCRSVVNWLTDQLNDDDGKSIVFAVHKKMIDALQRRLPFKSVVVDGSVSGSKRNSSVLQFQDDPETRVLIGNVQAAGVGLNLTAASSVVFAELPWQPGLVVQGEDRAHRIGQRKCVNVYYLVARGTVEERRCQIISGKQQTLEAVLDGGDAGNELDVFDEFLRGFRNAEPD